MITLQLNENQAKVLVQLMDIAIKAGGLNVAEAAMFFVKEIENQAAPKEEKAQE